MTGGRHCHRRWANARVPALVAVVLCTACTDRQVAQWVEWFESEPEEAVAFAQQPEVQALLAQREAEPVASRPARQAPTSRWDDIAWCESGGRWDYPPVTNRTGTYSGGLMIWTRAWDAYGGEEFASDAYLASKAEQIIVAERILADRGWQAWDCA